MRTPIGTLLGGPYRMSVRPQARSRQDWTALPLDAHDFSNVSRALGVRTNVKGPGRGARRYTQCSQRSGVAEFNRRQDQFGASRSVEATPRRIQLPANLAPLTSVMTHCR